jgi:hypothetical protein
MFFYFLEGEKKVKISSFAWFPNADLDARSLTEPHVVECDFLPYNALILLPHMSWPWKK